MITEVKKRGDKMDFGRTLLEFRARHDLTQKQLAHIIGVNTNTVYRTENGKTVPTQVNKIKFENKMKEWEENNNENVQV